MGIPPYTLQQSILTLCMSHKGFKVPYVIGVARHQPQPYTQAMMYPGQTPHRVPWRIIHPQIIEQVDGSPSMGYNGPVGQIYRYVFSVIRYQNSGLSQRAPFSILSRYTADCCHNYSLPYTFFLYECVRAHLSSGYWLTCAHIFASTLLHNIHLHFADQDIPRMHLSHLLRGVATTFPPR